MPTPLPILPNVYYAHTQMHYNGLPSGNIFTWRSSAASATEAQDLERATQIATDMATNWPTTVLPLYPDSVHCDRVRVYALGHATLPAAEVAMVGTGGTSSPMTAVSAAAIIKHTVLRRGRGSQSHSALSPLPIGAITGDGSSLIDGAVLDYTDEFENFIAAVTAGFAASFSGLSLDYVQLSKKGEGATYPITASACEKLLGTERSRTPRP